MKHKKILIFTDPGNQTGVHLQEMNGSANALYTKYSTRAHALEQNVEVELVEVDSSKVQYDILTLKATGQVRLETKKGNVTWSGDDDLVGVYVVAHGASPDLPGHLLEFMRMKGWRPANLDYINLVVCTTSTQGSGSNAGWQITPETKYERFQLAGFVQKLMELAMYPRVAGYAGFVTVANEDYPKYTPEAADLNKTTIGKKVRESSKPAFVSAKASSYKYVWEYREGVGYFEPRKFSGVSVSRQPLPLAPQSVMVPQLVWGTRANPLDVGPLARWRPDDDFPACARCNTGFHFFNRRHHCRVCGKVFCDDCSNQTAFVRTPLKAEGGRESGVKDVKVCKLCRPSDSARQSI
ncbi:MAG TPA: FYVE zinc finger domain-containing protein [Longimicrobium sp.]|jgi:hypothetical protein